MPDKINPIQLQNNNVIIIVRVILVSKLKLKQKHIILLAAELFDCIGWSSLSYKDIFNI